MDLQEWKKLSRSEKERAWEHLSESEKNAIKNKSRHSRSSSRKHNQSHSTKYHASMLPPAGWTPIILRIIGITAILIGLLTYFILPDIMGQQGMLSANFLVLMLAGLIGCGMACIIDRQAAILNTARGVEARLDRIEKYFRARPLEHEKPNPQ